MFKEEKKKKPEGDKREPTKGILLTWNIKNKKSTVGWWIKICLRAFQATEMPACIVEPAGLLVWGMIVPFLNAFVAWKENSSGFHAFLACQEVGAVTLIGKGRQTRCLSNHIANISRHKTLSSHANYLKMHTVASSHSLLCPIALHWKIAMLLTADSVNILPAPTSNFWQSGFLAVGEQ